MPSKARVVVAVMLFIDAVAVHQHVPAGLFVGYVAIHHIHLRFPDAVGFFAIPHGGFIQTAVFLQHVLKHLRGVDVGDTIDVGACLDIGAATASVQNQFAVYLLDKQFPQHSRSVISIGNQHGVQCAIGIRRESIAIEHVPAEASEQPLCPPGSGHRSRPPAY